MTAIELIAGAALVSFIVAYGLNKLMGDSDMEE